MANKILITLAMITLFFTASLIHASTSTFSVSNNSTQTVNVDFDYTQNNKTQTVPLIIGVGGQVNWTAPGQGQACLVGLQVNGTYQMLYKDNAPTYPACMQSANIHIWPAGNATVEGVTVPK
jgi:hypothetical protein